MIRLAALTLYKAEDMDDKETKEVVKWLKVHAKLLQEGQHYTYPKFFKAELTRIRSRA